MADPTGANVPAGGTATPPPSALQQAQSQFDSGAGGPGSGLSGGNQAIAPGAAVSPYELQLVENAKVILGSWMANALGIPADADTPVSGAYVLQAFDSLPQAKLTSVLTFLKGAGFYVNDEGVTPSSFDFNASDAINQNAITNALLVTYNKNLNASPKGSTLSSLTASLIASGAGQQELQTAPSPVLGGGNTYQVALTSPADLYNTLYSTFESALGQAPTQKQLNGFVTTFQGEQAKYQQALNAQQENTSLQKFHQQEQARNTELGYSRTPQVAGGPVPSGPFHTPAAWATAFVQYLNQAEGVPFTASNVAYVLSIMDKLGQWNAATSSFNPLGVQTPYPGPGQVETGKVNPNAPAKYSSWSVGMQATLDELANYPGILQLLLTGKASDPAAQAQVNASATPVSGEWQQWTNGKVTGTITPKPGQQAAADHATAVYTRTKTPAPAPAAPAQPAFPAQGQGQTGAQANAIASATIGAAAAENNPNARSETPASAAATAAADLAKQKSPDSTGQPFGPPAAGFPGSPGTPAAQPVQQEPTIAEAKAKAQQILAQAKGGKLPVPQIPTTPAANIVPGQDQYSTGDTYLGANTLVGTTPPSAQGLAFTQATTGANAVPYEGNEFLQAYTTIADMIASGKAAA